MNKFWQNFKFFLRWIASRNFFMYLLAVGLLWPISNYPSAIMQARSSALSRLIPQFDYLIDFRDGKVSFDREKMRDYYEYFKKVDAYLPEKADVMGLLAYTTYSLGGDRAAEKLYASSVLSYPLAFSFRYNLGALAYKRKDYQTAIKELSNALKTDFIENLKFISSSRIYFPLFRTPFQVDDELTEYMKIGYERCYRLLVLSYAAANDPTNELIYALQASSLPTKDPAFFNCHAGKVSAKFTRFRQALPFLSQCLSQNPQDADALFYLGLSLQASGQTALATETLQQAEKLKKTEKVEKPEEKIELQLY